MTTTREPSPLRTDFLAELWQNLSPYLGIAQMGLALVCLLAGEGRARGSWILCLFGLQIVLNILLSVQIRRIRNITLLQYLFAIFNWLVCVAVLILAGGYPSLFWLLFVLGAVQSGLFTGPKGVLLNTGFAAAALTVPVLLRGGMTAGIAFHIGLVTLLLWALGYITHKSTTMLMNERAKFQRAEEELRRSHAELTSALANQRQQARDLALLTEMGDFLQACPILEDTYAIIGYYTPRLLPFPHGVLYLGDESRDSFAAVSAWGGIESGKNSPGCTPAHCWALRREQIHWMDDSAAGMRCHHADSTALSHYMCVPLVAQREAVGVLHLQSRPGESESGIPAGEAKTRVLALAKSVGEQITLAVANLRLRETLRNQSIRDGLTGLFNRRYLEETLEREIHRAVREQAPLSIIFIDIDNFKSFNDRFGHEAGDAVLRQLGAFLTAQIRYEDIACRYGGEEFVVVLPDAALDIAAQRAEGIRTGVKSMKVQVGGRTLQGVTLSLGVSAIPECEAVGEILMRAADAALYQAKAEGRDRLVVAKPA
jgi:diguanylate cyclase (GGDEF)-like protein